MTFSTATPDLSTRYLGLPLDERVLRYTAGEDHALDARLVPYDVRGSIAHAEMLASAGLIR